MCLGVDDDGRTATHGYASDITLNIAAGSYTIQVVGYLNTQTGPYSLDIAEITPVVYDGAEVEPNETHLTATPTGVSGAGARRLLGNLAANTVVASGTVDAPVVAPIVDSGVSTPGSILFTGSVIAAPASTATVTQTTALSQPMANPPLGSYLPGMHLRMTSGANLGLTRLISSNTATAITTAAFPVANTAGDTFEILTVNSTTITWVNSLPLANLYIGTSAYSLRMTSGANVGLSRAISANTGPSAFGSEITTAAFPVANVLGDTYDIDCTTNTSTVLRTLAPMVPGLYSPTTGGFTLGHYTVRFTSGTAAGLERQIQGNTLWSINTASVTGVVAGDTFNIEQVDTDYWQIVLTAPFTGVWFQINEGDAPWVYGHKYELYNSLGNALMPTSSLQTPAFGTQNGSGAGLVARSSQVRVWPAGTYYLAVRNPVSLTVAAAGMPGGLVPTGNYMLEVFTMPMDTGATVTETEPVAGPNANNTAATATALAPGQVGRGNLTFSSGADPTDWWGPFPVSGPVTVTIQTRRQATATPMVDTSLNLRDAAGTLLLPVVLSGNILDVPSTSTVGPHGRVTVSFYAPFGNVYIEVASPGTTAGMSGDYELEVSELIQPPYVAASYGVAAANGTCGVAPFPTLTRQFPAEVPALGSLFARQLTNCPPNGLFLLMQGLSNTTANGGSLPLPYDLGSLGAPGCTIHVDPLAITFGVADGAGVADLQSLVPGAVAFRGFFWYEQAMVIVPTANTLGVQPSNYGRPIFGERSY